jgi:hypothetical protein
VTTKQSQARRHPALTEKRYCAFIDILGFQKLMEKLGEEMTPVDPSP